MENTYRFFCHRFARMCENETFLRNVFTTAADKALGFLTARELRELLRQIPASNEDFA